jgi:hypothetical protein
MLAIMSKYLENHDKDGVILYYCFIKHFAGATTENIIDAYQQLTESKVQLHLYKNDVEAFTNAIRIPTRQLANAQDKPTFQHMLNVYHGVMDCPNEEFRLYAVSKYREYRDGGLASKWSMLDLLDNLDAEYIRIKALNRWEKNPTQNSEIIALTAQLSDLKALIANLQISAKKETNPIDTNRSKKPAHPPKSGEKDIVTLNGVIWQWCQTCFGGKGSWNKTHTTSKHVVGAGKGYKGGEKEKNPPTPGGLTDGATANFATQGDENAASNGIFFV